MDTKQPTAVIIGAGPAGLTAALEFCRHSDIRPIVLESSTRIGGISCTVQYHGNRMDIGGHRFFSKSDRVMNWWTEIMPIAGLPQDGDVALRYHNQERHLCTEGMKAQVIGEESDEDRVMLVRPRKSHIYFMRSFFDYPLSLSLGTFRRLGLTRTIRILASYLKAQLFQRKPEQSLEDFFINRFGKELYRTFFKSYTEKVWGVPCDRISAAWGAQRIKGLSLLSAVKHFIQGLRPQRNKCPDIRQKSSETSLIEHFLYPKYGPGQLWETVAKEVQSLGGEIRLGWRVDGIHVDRDSEDSQRIGSIQARTPSGRQVCISADYFFSTMPVRDLVRALDAPVPEHIHEIADGLVYRDFITVGLLVDRLLLTEPDGSMLRDNWIYVQEPEVLLGRIQIFNNWSPHMVSDPSKVWLGLEYFCYESDPLWRKSDEEMIRFAVEEVERIGVLRGCEVRDACVIRVPKTYPAYFGTYDRFDEIISHMECYENLYLVGRNGMHKYNNQDHSMLTAMLAVENILAGRTSKENLWQVNTEQEYHEEKHDQETEPETQYAKEPEQRFVA